MLRAIPVEFTKVNQYQVHTDLSAASLAFITRQRSERVENRGYGVRYQVDTFVTGQRSERVSHSSSSSSQNRCSEGVCTGFSKTWDRDPG